MPGSVQFILGTLLTVAVASIVALFYAGDKSQLWDVLKLALQGIGALVIARLTVVWAVENFKSQKRWERDASTYSSILAALREMARVNAILWAEASGAKQYTKEYLDEAKVRSVTAKKKFEEAAAAAIFLPDEISSVVLELEASLANQQCDTCEEYIEDEGYFVSDALKQLASKRHLL